MGYNIKLVIVGHYNKKYDWIIVKEKVPDQELRELYSKALALIHPSSWEGFSYVALEAEAAGTPVVAYDSGGVRDSVLHGLTGFLVPWGDVTALCQYLYRLLTDRSLWRRMSEVKLR